MRWPLGLTLAFLLLVLIATLSRSGALGLLVGLVILAIPYRRFVWSRVFLAPLAAVALVVAYIFYSRRHFFSVVISSRLQTGGKSTSAHFAVYNFIPHVLHSNPLLGLGLNTFSVYYEFVTGKTNWGPHSYWVALIVETGLVVRCCSSSSSATCSCGYARPARSAVCSTVRATRWGGTSVRSRGD